MSVLSIVLLVFLALVVTLAVGGAVARARVSMRRRAQVASANEALARARAEDRGWDPEAMESAARVALKAFDVRELHLVQVVDRPGTDADEAVYRAVGRDGSDRDVRLGRQGGQWVGVTTD